MVVMAALRTRSNILSAPSISLCPMATPIGGCGVRGVCDYQWQYCGR